jgi:copper(I)-binding protein
MHLMFYGLHEPFVEGQSVRVHLVFETAGPIAVDLVVQRNAPHNADHGHSG